MTTTLPAQISQFYDKGIVLDTNLMILYVVGLHDTTRIRRFSRTSKYTEEDFVTLCQILGKFKRIYTTPNILTETSNLTEKGNDGAKFSFFCSFETVIRGMEEQYIKSNDLAKEKVFKKFGLADSSITQLASKGFLILTDDLNLSSYLSNISLPVMNFNHIRSLYLLS